MKGRRSWPFSKKKFREKTKKGKDYKTSPNRRREIQGLGGEAPESLLSVLGGRDRGRNRRREETASKKKVDAGHGTWTPEEGKETV